MANQIKITITERGTAKEYSRRIKKADQATDRFRIKTTGLTRTVGALRNKLLLVSFAIAAVGASLGKLARASGNAQETLSKFEAVFKDQADAARAFAEDLATATNRATIELIDFLSTLQDTFVPLGFTREAASALSQDLVKLAVDVASFNNKVDADVIRDFQSALVGNTETVRKYGIVITQAVLEQELINAGLAKSVTTATEAAKAQGRNNIILRSTIDAQGDAVKTADSFNNSMKGATAATLELAIALGDKLLPLFTPLIVGYTDLAKAATDALTEIKAATIDQLELQLVVIKLNKRNAEVIGQSTEEYDRQILTLASIIDLLKQEERINKALNITFDHMALRLPEIGASITHLADIEIREYTSSIGIATDATRLLQQALTTAFLSGNIRLQGIKDIVLTFMSLAEGVILASEAMSSALAFAFVPGLGTAAAVAALVALEAAKAGVRNIDVRAEGGFTSGRPVLLGERGPEIINPPAGSQIFTAAQSKQMTGPTTINLVVDGEVLATVTAPHLERGSSLGSNNIALT